MDSDGSNLDIAIVVGNNIRIRTECSDQSNNKVILLLAMEHLNLETVTSPGRRNENEECKRFTGRS